ncbi:serine hydrolase domain-containing protein [Aliikangiella maris]|uniref:Serine hydrolase n=2 Tax=Aliikangiella maris TaxID=3162458 RepID=A0ABV3MS58_9GAMM
MHNYPIRILFVLSLFLVVLSGCTKENTVTPSESEQKYQYQIPEATNDGWTIGHLADFDIEEPRISRMVQQIIDGVYPGIDSISIVRHNTLLLHQDFRDELSQYDDWVGNRDLERHLMHSTSKSVVSALFGIAHDQGFIPDLSAPLLKQFNYSFYQNWSEQKENITLEDTLTMRLGLQWDEWSYPFADAQNSLTDLSENNSDFVKALLDLPMDSSPGTTYAYNTVASIALGAVIQNKTGIPLKDFAQTFLFDPLQINRADWHMTPTGLANTGSGLFLKTRDMAKFGQLYLNNGQWNGMQLISKQWVEKSLRKSVDLHLDYASGYGYQWWLGEFDDTDHKTSFYSTRGHGGQFIIIIPNYDLIIAFTGHNYTNDLQNLPFKLVEQYILPSIQF